jgi:hypothetical protein
MSRRKSGRLPILWSAASRLSVPSCCGEPVERSSADLSILVWEPPSFIPPWARFGDFPHEPRAFQRFENLGMSSTGVKRRVEITSDGLKLDHCICRDPSGRYYLLLGFWDPSSQSADFQMAIDLQKCGPGLFLRRDTFETKTTFSYLIDEPEQYLVINVSFTTKLWDWPHYTDDRRSISRNALILSRRIVVKIQTLPGVLDARPQAT